MDLKNVTLVMIPEEELANLKNMLQDILQYSKTAPAIKSRTNILPAYITAKEFMSAVKICRSMFDRLISENKIKTVKKKRKIYVPASEVERYFSDPSIQ